VNGTQEAKVLLKSSSNMLNLTKDVKDDQDEEKPIEEILKPIVKKSPFAYVNPNIL
jgi:hypothetical protein